MKDRETKKGYRNQSIDITIHQDPFIEDILVITVRQYQRNQNFSISKKACVNKLYSLLVEVLDFPQMLDY